MLEVHRELDERYQALRDSRSGPVYFIEHGFSEDEVADVVADVGRALDAHPLESGWWQSHRLPLIVVATEVGYRYRGSGTDFWPVLEAELGVHVSASDRQRIRDLFDSASKAYRGALPPATPWAEAFHLIAWPIVHALVPLEFHRPLALTLASLRMNVAGLSDDDLHRTIRIVASSSSARFSTLLEDAALVVGVTRSLLGDASAELCPETVQRIVTDLAADQVARRGVAVARRIQRSAPERTTPRASSRAPLPSISGSLQIRRRDGVMSLEAVFPPVQAPLRSRLRRALRRRRYAACLWGVSARVPSEQLLSGLPFTVKLTSAPPEDAELLPGLHEVDLDQGLRDLLAAFALDVASPLLFAVASDEQLGRRVRGPSISGHRKYWLLSRSDDLPRGCPVLGEVGPYTCHLLDPAEDAARNVLALLGFQVRFGVSVGFAGAPPFDREAPVPVFAAGDQRLVVPRRAPPEGLSVQVGEGRVRLSGDDVVSVLVERGEHTLCVSSGDESREFAFRGTPSSPTESPTICSIEPRSDDLSVQALLRGTLTFAVESFAPLEGLELTVEFEASGRGFHASAPLGPLPCVLSSDREPFATLFDDKTRELIAQTPSLALRLSVGQLCTYSLVLEQRVRPCWWQHSGDDEVSLQSEVGDLPFGWVAATDPAGTPESGPTGTLDEARLLAPIDVDLSLYGGSAAFTTLCVAPNRTRLEVPVIKKPRLARRRRADPAALGLEDVVEGYLRWALAESRTLVAEMRRRQITDVLDGWLVEICCGEEWRRREAALVCAGPWEVLVRACDETGFGRDSYVELSRKDEAEVTRVAVQEIRRDRPELWARIGPPCDLGEEDYEALDLACGRAYSELARRYKEHGRDDLAAKIADGDPGAAAEDWVEVLERVKSTVELQPLAAMLLPSDSAIGLMSLDPSVMTLDELTEEFCEWARSARKAFAGSVPPDDTFKAILALWIEPEVAVNLDWRGALDTVLAERVISRAARYLALRSRQATRGGSAQ